MTVVGKDDDSPINNLLDKATGTVKVQIVPATPKTLSHLPPRPAVNLAFNNLYYRVKEGRKTSKF